MIADSTDWLTEQMYYSKRNTRTRRRLRLKLERHRQVAPLPHAAKIVGHLLVAVHALQEARNIVAVSNQSQYM